MAIKSTLAIFISLLVIAGCALNDPDFSGNESPVALSENAMRWQTLLEEGIQAFKDNDIVIAENRFNELDAISADFPETDARRAITLMTIAAFYEDTDRMDEAEPRYRTAYDIIPEIYGPDTINMAICCDSLARISALRQHFPEAERLLQKSLTIYEKLGDAIQVGLTYGKLADVHRTQNRFDSSEKYYISALSKLNNDQDSIANIVSIQLGLGMVFLAKQSYSEAIPLFNKVLNYFEKTLEPSDLRLLFVLNSLADAYIGLEKFSDAEINIKRIIEIQKAKSGNQSPEQQSILKKLASVYSAQGRYNEAEQILDQSPISSNSSTQSIHDQFRALYEKIELYRIQNNSQKIMKTIEEMIALSDDEFDPTDPEYALTLSMIADICRQTNDFQKATALYDQAIAILQNLGAQGADYLLNVQTRQAMLYAAQGDADATERALIRIVSQAEEMAGTEHISVAAALNNLTAFYVQSEKYNEALPLSYRIIRILESNLGSQDPNLAVALENCAGILERTGQTADAGKMKERAKKIRGQ